MAIKLIGGYDLETTGFCEPEHRIIEACVMVWKCDTDTWEFSPVGKKTWRYNPERSIPAKAFAVHGISEADLVNEPTFAAAGKPLVALLNRLDMCVAHNGFGFDFPFTLMECERVGFEEPDFLPFDTMIDGRWATAFGEVPSLKKLCFTCDVSYNPAEAHAAEYDVQKMMECFFYGVSNGYFTPEL